MKSKKLSKKLYRGISLVAAIVMVLGLCPVLAFGEDATDEIQPILNYRRVDFTVDAPYQTPTNSKGGASTAEEIPSKYSSVTEGNITPIKDQGSNGTCWAFSAMATAEASLISSGAYTKNNLDLSELQLAYFNYTDKYDPLGNATGDGTYVNESGETYLSLGGNHCYTMWQLAGWTGSTTESSLPYSKASGTAKFTYSNYTDVAHLQNAYIIPYDATLTGRFNYTFSDKTTESYASGVASVGQNANIKNAIMEYGAVAISYIHTYNWWTSENDYGYTSRAKSGYSSTYASLYSGTELFNDEYSGGHAVTVVGWNDNYPRTQFAATAPGDGAWLIKNSWGTGGTDGDAEYDDYKSATHEGYYWLSYWDLSICDPEYNGKVYVFDYEPADNYDYNYQYDGGAGNSRISLDPGCRISAKYEVKKSDQTIDAVGFGVYSTNVNYSIDLYKISSLSSGMTSGTKLFSKPITGTTTYAGYYTIPIDNPPELKKGEFYSVVITLKNANGSTKSISIPIDSTYSGSWIRFVSNTTNDHTAYSSTSTSSFLDLTGYSLRVKAYGNRVGGDSNWKYSCKTLTLTGGGATYSNYSGSAPWSTFNTKVTSLVIPSTVESLDKTAFSALKNVTEIHYDGSLASLNALVNGISVLENATKYCSSEYLVGGETVSCETIGTANSISLTLSRNSLSENNLNFLMASYNGGRLTGLKMISLGNHDSNVLTLPVDSSVKLFFLSGGFIPVAMADNIIG